MEITVPVVLIGKPLINVRGSEIPILSRDHEGVGWECYFVTLAKKRRRVRC
jgi:hypothetical protein